MVDVLNRLFRVERDEWPQLLQFGLFGFLLQTGLGVGFSAGDAAFLSNVGADHLPLVFMATPAIMVVYTAVFSFFLVRYSIDRMVDVTLGALVVGGVGIWVLVEAGLPGAWQTPLYFGMKLYLVMWYIAIYSLYWNYTDAYFDIQDAKRLFPLFAAFCSLGTAFGAALVGIFAEALPVQGFFLLWAALAAATFPLARLLRQRWQQIAENDDDRGGEAGGTFDQLALAAKAFGSSRYTIALTATLFVTLLMTNLAEYQYSVVLQEGRSEAELAALFGLLYAGASLFNLVTCLFIFNRLVARFGVRNVAFIQPLTYFAVFGWFFFQGGPGAALAAFFAYHGVLTSIEYNNQNLLFNAMPSQVKRPLRTMIEGMAEPLASLLAGGALLYAASRLDMRELSGIGLIVGAVLVAIVILMRQLYPAAMVANMRQGWLNFGARDVNCPRFDADARTLLKQAAAAGPKGGLADRFLAAAQDAPPSPQFQCAGDEGLSLPLEGTDEQRACALRALSVRATRVHVYLATAIIERLPDMQRAERTAAIELLGLIGDSESVSEMLSATAAFNPRDRRAMASILANLGETAIPRLIAGMNEKSLPYRSRIVAAFALADLSYAQFAAHLDRLVYEELQETRALQRDVVMLDRHAGDHRSIALLARAQRERVGAGLDFVLELLAIAGRLPDFDLLVVSLHSANAKVRGNAIETIESGVDAALFQWIEPLLRQNGVSPDSADQRDLDFILDAALGSGQPIEMTLAADIWHARLSPKEFMGKVRLAIDPGMPRLLRDHLLQLTGLRGDDGVSPLRRLAALAAHPAVGGSTLEALLLLARKAQSKEPADPALHTFVEGHAIWVARSDLHDIAARFPDLALVLLRSQDDRQYAV